MGGPVYKRLKTSAGGITGQLCVVTGGTRVLFSVLRCLLLDRRVAWTGNHTEVTEQPFTEYKALSVSTSRVSYVPCSPVRWVEHFHGIFSAPLAVRIGLGRSQGER